MIDRYLDRVFDQRRYNCLHFARDVWFDLTGVDIVRLIHKGFRPFRDELKQEHVASFRELRSPSDPCLVLMQGGMRDPHVGVFLRGKILHLRAQGAEFVPVEIAALGFSSVRYFLP